MRANCEMRPVIQRPHNKTVSGRHEILRLRRKKETRQLTNRAFQEDNDHIQVGFGVSQGTGAVDITIESPLSLFNG